MSVINRGDGSYVVSAGRPVERLTADEMAKRLGVSRNTIYRYIGDGTIPVSGMTPTAQDAVGGVAFSDSTRSSAASTARPQMFSRYRLGVY